MSHAFALGGHGVHIGSSLRQRLAEILRRKAGIRRAGSLVAPEHYFGRTPELLGIQRGVHGRQRNRNGHTFGGTVLRRLQRKSKRGEDIRALLMESNGCVQGDDHIFGHLWAHVLQRRHGGSCVKGTHLRLHDALVNGHLPVSEFTGGMRGLDIECRHGDNRTATHPETTCGAAPEGIREAFPGPGRIRSHVESLSTAGIGVRFCGLFGEGCGPFLYSLFTAFRSGQRAHAPAGIDKSPLQILVPGSTHDGCTRRLFRPCGPCQLPGQRTKHSGEDSITSEFNAGGNGGVKRCRGHNDILWKWVAVGILLFQHRCDLASAFKFVRALPGPDHVSGEAGSSRSDTANGRTYACSQTRGCNSPCGGSCFCSGSGKGQRHAKAFSRRRGLCAYGSGHLLHKFGKGKRIRKPVTSLSNNVAATPGFFHE